MARSPCRWSRWTDWTRIPPPARPRAAGRHCPAAAPRAASAPPETDPAIRAQVRHLRALARAITGTVGAGAACELRRQDTQPFLPYLQVQETPVWAVSTSAGWRFLWNRYRSHPVTDPAGGGAGPGGPPRPRGGAAPAPPLQGGG